MRFQSNSTASKLSPDFIADAYGPCVVGTVIANTGTTVTILGPPPAGQYYQIFSISIRATTTTTTTGNLTVVDTSGNNVLVGFYENPNGQMKEWVGPMGYASQLNLRNSMTVTGYCTIWWRTVPIPS